MAPKKNHTSLKANDLLYLWKSAYLLYTSHCFCTSAENVRKIRLLIFGLGGLSVTCGLIVTEIGTESEVND